MWLCVRWRLATTMLTMASHRTRIFVCSCACVRDVYCVQFRTPSRCKIRHKRQQQQPTVCRLCCYPVSAGRPGRRCSHNNYHRRTCSAHNNTHTQVINVSDCGRISHAINQYRRVLNVASSKKKYNIIIMLHALDDSIR